jgi:hypothetical protein
LKAALSVSKSVSALATLNATDPETPLFPRLTAVKLAVEGGQEKSESRSGQGGSGIEEASRKDRVFVPRSR